MNADSVPDAGIPRSQDENLKTIGKEFSFKELIGFVIFPVVTQVIISLLQTIDDGLFLSRYVGQDALASFSICFPIIMLMDAVASLFCGANPLCSILMGEKEDERASSIFTTVSLICLITGSVICMLLRIDTPWVLTVLGASDRLLDNALAFINVNLWAFPFTILSTFFNRFYVVAGKPKYTIITTLINAFCNFFFDWLFIVKKQLGIVGAAYADVIATATLCLFGFIVYSSKSVEIGFGKPDRNLMSVFKEVLPYGIPQMFTSLTVSINGVIDNRVLMSIAGEIGVSAYTIVNNIQFVFMAAFFGMSTAVCPLASYAYGERNRDKLVRVLKQILYLTVLLSGAIVLLYLFGDKLMMRMYIPKGSSVEMEALVAEGLKIAPFGFLFFGFNVLAQDIFNAINDNRTATVLAILENLVFSNLCIFILPKLFGLTGVWSAFAVAEAFAFLFVVLFAYKDRDRYGYGKSGTATFIDEEE